jgi:hypothetical protein
MLPALLLQALHGVTCVLTHPYTHVLANSYTVLHCCCRDKALLFPWDVLVPRAGAAWRDSSTVCLTYYARCCCCCRHKALLFLWDEHEQALHGVFRASASDRPLPEARMPGVRVQGLLGSHQVGNQI